MLVAVGRRGAAAVQTIPTRLLGGRARGTSNLRADRLCARASNLAGTPRRRSRRKLTERFHLA
jgi:hypothetical protein